MGIPSQSGQRRRTNGWLLHPNDRNQLLGVFAPAHPDVIAHHVTLTSGIDSAGIPWATHGFIVGRANDQCGVEALVLEIEGTTRRPDGGTYHITWSLDRSKGREARQSNDVISAHGWQAVERLRVNLMPALWERETGQA